MVDGARNPVKGSGRIRPGHLHGNIGFGDVFGQFAQRSFAIVLSHMFDGVSHLLKMLLEDGKEQRFLVRKVLVERADRYTGSFGHPGGRQPRQSISDQNLNHGFVNGLNRSAGPRLSR